MPDLAVCGRRPARQSVRAVRWGARRKWVAIFPESVLVGGGVCVLDRPDFCRIVWRLSGAVAERRTTGARFGWPPEWCRASHSVALRLRARPALTGADNGADTSGCRVRDDTCLLPPVEALPRALMDMGGEERYFASFLAHVADSFAL